MDKLRFSIFNNKRDTKPQPFEKSWQEFCEDFKKPEVRAEKDGPLFSPATFEPSYRKKQNVMEVSMLPLDIDHNADLETIKNSLAGLGWAYLIYSTHSHLRKTDSNPNAEPRYRVCIPLSYPIPAKDFPALWQYIKQKTGLPLDESAKDVSRMFYTSVIAAEDAPYEFYVADGEFLDWQKLNLNSIAANGSEQGNNKQVTDCFNNPVTFMFHEDRHNELCRRIETKARDTGRGTFEMKCPVHNGKGDSSLFYDPKTKAVKCLKDPTPCSYSDILGAFDLPKKRLRKRETAAKVKDEKISQANLILDLAADIELFHTSDSTTFASIEVGGHKEIHPVYSKAFREYLSYQFYKTERKSPSTQALQSAINSLSGKAKFEGEMHDVHIRLASFNGKIYLDLCNDTWQIIEIDAEGRRVIEAADAPVRFQRTKAMLALPTPIENGDINKLRKFLNVSKSSFILILAWLVNCFRPGYPFPILNLIINRDAIQNRFKNFGLFVFVLFKGG